MVVGGRLRWLTIRLHMVLYSMILGDNENQQTPGNARGVYVEMPPLGFLHDTLPSLKY